MSNKQIKRVRMFAGPNGSGKSTVFRNINRQFSIGHYVNADDIEVQFKKQGFINFYDYNLVVSDEYLQSFIQKSTLFTKAKNSGLDIHLKVVDNIVITNIDNVHSYEAALLTSFIRSELIKDNQSFSFETVMSHSSKSEILRQAKSENYQTYLYFISTDDANTNVDRVRDRVSKGGHPVPEDKIVSRYNRSLDLLASVIKHTYRTFIFDNSKETHNLILEIYQGKEIIFHREEVPAWVKKYLLDKLL